MKITRVLLFVMIAATVVSAQTKTSAINSRAGAFSRMGFGARGMGMGNAASAVSEGNLVSYYNPALSVFQKGNSAVAGVSFLSLDRRLNFLNFTRRFEFYSSRDTLRVKPASTAGFSVGVINAGVSGIDGRDNQGIKTGELSTSENMFFLSVANRFSDKLALGLSIKFLYFKLYEKMSSSGLGFDIGAIYSFSERAKLSLMLSDLNSKYRWDSSPIYEQQGRITEDKFPTLKKIGFSYHFRNPDIIADIELESSNVESNYMRVGAEYRIIDEFMVRAGMDKWNLKNSETPVRPAAGFTLLHRLGSFMLNIDYAFMSEPYSAHDQHVLGLGVVF